MSKPKWDIVLKYCAEKGYEKSMESAVAIADTLRDIYGIKYEKLIVPSELIPKKWNDKSIASLACHMDYCIACVESDGCQNCEFGKQCGGCLGNRSSLYDKFTAAYTGETGVKLIYIRAEWMKYYDSE